MDHLNTSHDITLVHFVVISCGRTDEQEVATMLKILVRYMHPRTWGINNKKTESPVT